MTNATQNTERRTILVTLSERWPDPQTLFVLEEREKSFFVENDYTGKKCWVPKSGLQPRKPGVATYEDEYTIKPWFKAKMSPQQERALGILE